MRRSDREVTDAAAIRGILSRCQTMRIGFFDGQEVYIVPLNFGMLEKDGGYTFYFHGAREGRKIDLIASHPRVGFEADTNYRLNEADEACGYSARFQSVVGNGVMEMVTDPAEKAEGLRRIMEHATGKPDWDFPASRLDGVAVFKLTVTHLSAKEHA